MREQCWEVHPRIYERTMMGGSPLRFMYEACWEVHPLVYVYIYRKAMVVLIAYAKRTLVKLKKFRGHLGDL